MPRTGQGRQSPRWRRSSRSSSLVEYCAVRPIKAAVFDYTTLHHAAGRVASAAVELLFPALLWAFSLAPRPRYSYN